MFRQAPVFFVLCATMLSATQAVSGRTWTDSTGKYKIEAEFVKLDGQNVHLRREDGRIVQIPINRLSQGDQDHVRELTAPADESPFALSDEPAGPAKKHLYGIRPIGEMGSRESAKWSSRSA